MKNNEEVPFYATVAKKSAKKKVSSEKNKTVQNSQSNFECNLKTEHSSQTKNSNKNSIEEKSNFIPQQKTKTFESKSYYYKVVSNLFMPLSKETEVLINKFDDIIQSVNPLNSRQLCSLPNKIRELSHDLTDTRKSRRLGYMNSKENLSAYVRYFSWWNLYRLCSIFESLNADYFSFLKDDDVILDIGSGPLTAVIALWISRPELRKRKINIIATDLSHGALSLGEELYLAVVARSCSEKETAWRITRIKGAFGIEIRQKASFVICANMFNELVHDSKKTIRVDNFKTSVSGDISIINAKNKAKPTLKSNEMSNAFYGNSLIEENVENCKKKLLSYVDKNAVFFVAEPGVPFGGRFISILRSKFIQDKFAVDFPCTHINNCVFSGAKNEKWCHFVRDTSDAPKSLLKCSESAGLPKDRASISFLFANSFVNSAETASDKNSKKTTKDNLAVRVVSDEILLPFNMRGRYGCSKWGAILLTYKSAKNIKSGSLVQININESQKTFCKRQKTGFLTIELN